MVYTVWRENFRRRFFGNFQNIKHYLKIYFRNIFILTISKLTSVASELAIMWKHLKKAQTASNKPESKESSESMLACLPGPLLQSMPASTIVAANMSVSKYIERTSQSSKQGKYQRYSDTERAEIGRRAVEMGITPTIKYYEELNPKRPLPSSSVYTWKVQYAEEVAKLKREGKEPVVKDFPNKKKRRKAVAAW